MASGTCVSLYDAPKPIPVISRTADPTRYVRFYACLGIHANTSNDTRTLGNLSFLKSAWDGTLGLDGTRSCLDWFSDYVYTNPDLLGVDPVRYDNVKTYIEYLLSRYYAADNPSDDITGHQPSISGQIGYDTFQETITSMCSSGNTFIPGICDMALTEMCLGCADSRYSFSRYDYSNVRRMCGCYLNPNPHYTDVAPECDPACAPGNVAKKVSLTTADSITTIEPNLCETAVCVINDVSITAVAGSTIGSLNFNQVCPQCENNSGCRCIVDSQLKGLGFKLGIPNATSFHQYCGGAGSICMEINPITQIATQVDCDTKFNEITATKYSFPIPVWVWITIGIIVVVGILALFSAFYTKRLGIQEKEPSVPPPSVPPPSVPPPSVPPPSVPPPSVPPPSVPQLETQYPQLETQYPQLETQYPQLETQYPQLETQYPQLETQYSEF